LNPESILFEKRKDLTIEVPEDDEEERVQQRKQAAKPLRSVKLMSKVLLRQPTPRARKIL
jgi:hypothetical protein